VNLLSVNARPVTLRRAGATFGPALTIVAAQQVLFPSRSSSGEFLWYLVIQGITLGLLIALVALGMALIYRANRVLNFAQGDLGLVPTVLALNLIVLVGFNYFLAAAVGLAAAVVVGAVVELAIIRRFYRAPRLILTVATIGLAQLLAFASLTIPLLWGGRPIMTRISMPLDWRWDVGIFPFGADHLAVWVLAPAAMVAVALFLRFTAVGVAVRAAAERSDRAALLGVPVGRLHTYVWTIACVLSFLALFLRAGIVGLPLGPTLGLTVLLTALAALMVGKLSNLPAVVSSAVALGLLEAHVRNNDVLVIGPLRVDLGTDLIIAPILAVVIVVALLAQRRGTTRAETDETSTWQASAEVRPVPRELRHLPEVRLARLGGLALVAALTVAVPFLPGIGQPGNTLKAAAVLVFAVIILSVTVLTGWAGQVSLGQMGFVAFGAAVGAKATSEWGLDLALALPLAGVVGAVIAVLVGLPALRLRGLYLAVTTLAFALATTGYLLNPRYFDWVPLGRFERTPLLGRWDYADSPAGIYYLCLVVLVLALAAVAGIRRSRTGRILVALRENERGVQAFGVSAVSAKLTAFALSGFLAAVGGALLVHHNGSFTLGLFPDQDNLVVFTAAVVGGLGSSVGALLGALFLMGGRWFLEEEWRLFASSMGVLLVLLLLPGGLSGVLFRGRDLALRWVARRRDIVVPSLVADVRRLEGEAEVAFERRAGEMATEAAAHEPHAAAGAGDRARAQATGETGGGGQVSDEKNAGEQGTDGQGTDGRSTGEAVPTEGTAPVGATGDHDTGVSR
jgi:branched-chain amino acid transport system permease protein